MSTGLTLALRSLIGDGRYHMLREKDICKEGYQRYADAFRKTPAPRNLLFCVPEHCNIGDHAIAYAERRLLADSDRPLLEFGGNMARVLKCIREFVTPDDVIFLHGGGNMGTLYQNEEQYRCDIISMLPHNKIILFPQTISYDDTPHSQQYLRHTKSVYGRHKDLHLVAREAVSYDRMREYYPKNDVRLTPDIVLSLTDQATAASEDRHGILLCMRGDVEKTTTASAQSTIEAAAKATGEHVAYTDTTIPDKYMPIYKERGEELVLGKFDEFRKAKLVVTDRLHGMIFSAVTGTPCIAMNNSTGKVGFEYQWLKDFPYIAFAENADEAVELIPQMVGTALKSKTPPRDLLESLAPQFTPLTALL
ncbi:polysaccharide pyruvyl transferase family protein [Bifidobacterium leontopitheci]|uniref:Polysaccharide pyruvyl transferase n=1 Tax=Bifidobacterium leontopitheci TaxID=2650774 RepID=A0A6I1GD23_9BIFI|nr:polysaccharide pyruvyl transferase family protein [Bifidobacterium leontopitheci]KAB7789553.1 Polysaccharide pyruvyl transferase [Bifidobacterium leontopitheci]